MPDVLPVVALDVGNQKVVVSSGIFPWEDHIGVYREIRESGMPLKAIALLRVGSKLMVIADAKNYKFKDSDGLNPLVLILPIAAGPRFHDYTITAPPTNAFTVQLPETTNNERKHL